MQKDSSIHVGARVGLVDIDVIRLGTVSEVLHDGHAVRVTWDDGYDDSGPEGVWSFPSLELKPVA